MVCIVFYRVCCGFYGLIRWVILVRFLVVVGGFCFLGVLFGFESGMGGGFSCCSVLLVLKVCDGLKFF